MNFIVVRSEIHELNVDVAVAASEAFFQLLKKARREGLANPSLTDGIVLAIARVANSKLISGDRHLKNLPSVIYIGE